MANRQTRPTLCGCSKICRARSHQVFSAVSVLQLPSGLQETRVHETTVVMRDYSDQEITDYVNSGDPLDKAGAYGIQARPFAPVCVLDGCYAGVMGLPLTELRDLLADCGLTIRALSQQSVQLTIRIPVAPLPNHNGASITTAQAECAGARGD